MMLTVNGERREARSATVRRLLGELDYETEFVAVAVNYTVLPRGRWDEPVLKDGDAVEIVSPRQGG
ncbi:sulfur carrier protein ThiS [Chelatococcus reniformis]|uniref:Thiamine biosynthesis protein ThiS n=1 Tax=Chelatococcus reniformis TaxID=1494448 RepID=A0A916UBP6_9HYPH|nr:sulfur carrier protein ThiS [Chelatococcus reniformis]GGC67040.1 thiamine biosynthesis protein ThiS [Chelatococcus reniformis]